jgi:phosphatidate cytidylyltransferase
MMNELMKRIAVGIVGMPLVIYLVFLGAWYFFLLIFIISMVAQWEFYHMQKKSQLQPQIINGMIVGVICLLGIQTEKWLIFGSLIIFMLMIIFAYGMLRHHKNVSTSIGVTLLGVIYIPFFLGLLMHTRSYIDHNFPQVEFAGFKFIFILLATIWICDTFAYGIGYLLGAHKLYEKVSPNKTIEGALAGLLSAVCTIVIVKYLQIFPLGWDTAIILGLTIGLIGQTGDLIESWFKRDAGVKDSSALLPGHGGMLDRFDSLIFLSPAMLIIISIFF